MSTPLAYNMKGACEATGLSRSYLDRAIRAGQLKARRSGKDEHGDPAGNRVILAADLQAFLDGLVSE